MIPVIKLRNYDRISKKMELNPLIVPGSTETTPLNALFNKRGAMDEEVVPTEYNYVWMRYTGRKDKHGKEIWEGDIVNNGVKYTNPGVLAQNYAVVWNQQDSCWDLAKSACTLAQSAPEKRLEVIGNIYQNRNLLKGLSV